MEADGNVRLDGGAVSYSGTFRLRPKQGAGETGAAQAASASPYRLGGSFALDHQRLAVDEFLFETGPPDNPYTAEGSGSIEFAEEDRRIYDFTVESDGVEWSFTVDDVIAVPK